MGSVASPGASRMNSVDGIAAGVNGLSLGRSKSAGSGGHAGGLSKVGSRAEDGRPSVGVVTEE